MANAHYYGTLFQSNGTATVAPTRFDATLPTVPTRGLVYKVKGSIAIPAVLVATDTLYFARVPANHRVTGLTFQFTEIDSGTSTTMEVGVAADGTTYDDPDAYVDVSLLFRAAANLKFPMASGVVGVNNPATWMTGPAAAGTPNIEYNIVGVAGGTSTTAATINYEIEYVADPVIYDDVDSPAVVAGTQ